MVDAIKLLKAGRSPSKIANQTGAPVSSIMSYLNSQIATGKIAKSDIIQTIDKGTRDLIETLISKLNTTYWVYVYREAQKLGTPVDRDDLQIYLQMRESARPKGGTAASLVMLEESDVLEFKSALTWDYKEGKQNKQIEYAVAKTLCAFMNSKGGTLLLGVDDKREVLGLDKDFSVLRKPGKSDKDRFEQKLTGLVASFLTIEVRPNIRLAWDEIASKAIAVVTVEASKSPIYVMNLQGRNEFYVRAGNLSQPLDVKEATRYILDHWPKP